jgi:hypothetical protein
MRLKSIFFGKQQCNSQFVLKTALCILQCATLAMGYRLDSSRPQLYESNSISNTLSSMLSSSPLASANNNINVNNKKQKKQVNKKSDIRVFYQSGVSVKTFFFVIENIFSKNNSWVILNIVVN